MRLKSSVSAHAKTAFGVLKRNQPDRFRASADKLVPILSEKRAARQALQQDKCAVTLAAYQSPKQKVQRAIKIAMQECWQDLSLYIENSVNHDSIRGMYSGA